MVPPSDAAADPLKILVPDSLDIDLELPPGAIAVRYDVTAPIPQEHRDAQGLLIWGSSRERMAAFAADLPHMRWVQGLAAGSEVVTSLGFGPDVVLTTGVGLHTLPVAEHALALTLALVRKLPAAARAQAERHWSYDIGGIQPLHPPTGQVTTLLDARVLIWGFGQIGQHLAGLIAPLGARVRGVARSAGERGGFDVITDAELDEALPETDVLIMVLPTTPDTDRALDAHRLSKLRAGALLVNVGRGSTVDEDALIESLRSGHLGGAALDVTAIEPLPGESPLWDAPNAIITPHAAGGRPVGAAELIADNAAALLAGKPLRNVVTA
ncbi:MAG TPA: NAD(P)-dependent oxidoreductase [Actinomycetaceae bacterium]|nr:NAD(P)-dependent oxidoreductase [Actinomycetaceae bacterium]